MRVLRRLFWPIVLALALLGMSLLLGHWFFKAEADAPDIEATVRYWAEIYGVDPEYFVWIARAESDLDQAALGRNGELGLFQFKAGTWVWIREQMGLSSWTWLRLDPSESAHTAAFAFSIGLDSHWTTARGCR